MTDNPHGLVLPPELNPRGGTRLTPRGRRVARVLSWLAILTSLSVIAVSAVGYALYLKFDGNIGRVPFAPGGNRPAKAGGKALNFLLVGSDSREGASPAELKQFATQFTPGRRSDTMILVHLAADRKRVTLVSFPRDAWVEIPAYGSRPAHMAKINTAFAAGGQNLAAQTVEHLTGVRVDHYIEVNFAGFQRIVDALGGVEICLSQPAREKNSGINLPAGRQVVKGTQALAFVRQRDGVPGGDLGRIRRQQQFIGGMMRRATSTGVLLNPARLLRFLDTATKSLQVDETLPNKDLKALAFAMRNLDPGRVSFLTVPVDRLARRGGQSVVLIDEAAAAELFAAVRDDRPVGPEPAAPSAPPSGGGNPLTVAPSRVRLTVLNGTTTSKFAARAADDLREVGFRVLSTGNADATTYAETLIRYSADRADSARTVAAAIPGSKLLADPGANGVTVVLGRNYQGARPVTVRPTTGTTTSPRPTATSSAAPITAADDPCS